MGYLAMDNSISGQAPATREREQDRRIAETLERDGPRLKSFIRRRVEDLRDAEDILQEVFFELTEAYRSLRPAEEMTAWLYRVARNRIADLFRRRRTVSLDEAIDNGDQTGASTWEELLPSPDAGPDAVFARKVLLEELEDALAELPEAQRRVFLAHELQGLSFQQIAAETGESINTLLSRKRYAVLHLRKRLREIAEDFGIEQGK